MAAPAYAWCIFRRIAVGSVITLLRPVRDQERAEKEVQLSEDEHLTLLQAMGLKVPKRRKSEQHDDESASRTKRVKLSEGDQPPKVPPTIKLGIEWSCLWCLRKFSHPPAWGVHSKVCTYTDPLYGKGSYRQDELDPVNLKKARLKLLRKSNLEDIEMWKQAVITLAERSGVTADDGQNSSADEQQQDEEEMEEIGEEASAKQRELAKEAEAQREAQQRQREEADRARAMRVVKRLVSKLPSNPRKLTVGVVLSLYTAEEIRAILSVTVTEFAAEAAEAAAAEAEGKDSYYRVDAADNLSEEDEKMLLAKRLVALVWMRVQQADPNGSEGESSSEASEEEADDEHAETRSVDPEQLPSRTAEDKPDSSQRSADDRTTASADGPAGSTASASTVNRPASPNAEIDPAVATGGHDQSEGDASQSTVVDQQTSQGVRAAPASSATVDQQKPSSAGDAVVGLKAAKSEADDSVTSTRQMDASASSVPQQDRTSTEALLSEPPAGNATAGCVPVADTRQAPPVVPAAPPGGQQSVRAAPAQTECMV